MTNDDITFDYADVANDVRTRGGLAPDVRAPLTALAREDWSGRAGFEGFPAHFLAVHAELRGAAETLVERLRNVADEASAARADRWRALGIGDLAGRLTRAAHHHHDLEEANLFPWLAHAHPTFARAMRLLDGDHRVLEETLARVESDIVATSRSASAASPTPPALAPALGPALAAADALASLLRRHLADEEEIAVPALLGAR